MYLYTPQLLSKLLERMIVRVCIVCVDINECKRQHGGCPSHSKCVNTVGSYRCVCRPGFHMGHGKCEGQFISFTPSLNFIILYAFVGFFTFTTGERDVFGIVPPVVITGTCTAGQIKQESLANAKVSARQPCTSKTDFDLK